MPNVRQKEVWVLRDGGQLPFRNLCDPLLVGVLERKDGVKRRAAGGFCQTIRNRVYISECARRKRALLR